MLYMFKFFCEIFYYMECMEVAIQRRNKRERTLKIVLEPQGFGEEPSELFKITDLSFYDLWIIESYNNFNNPLAKAMKLLYDKTGWFALITHDKIIGDCSRSDSEGRRKINAYVSHAGTAFEEVHRGLILPPHGFWVPVSNKITEAFYPGTAVPIRTVPTREEAIIVWMENGFPKGIAEDYVSRLRNPVPLKNGEEQFVYRAFSACDRNDARLYTTERLCDINHSRDWKGDGRFYDILGFLPGPRCYDRLAAIPSYKEPKTAGKIQLIVE